MLIKPREFRYISLARRPKSTSGGVCANCCDSREVLAANSEPILPDPVSNVGPKIHLEIRISCITPPPNHAGFSACAKLFFYYYVKGEIVRGYGRKAGDI